MLFPNARAGHQIAPGMGYAPGSFALRGYKGGISLGDISPSEEQAALDSNASVTQADLDLLSSLGADDTDIEALINGNVTLPELYAEFGVTIPSASASAPASTAAPASGASGAPWSSPGTTLAYQVRWNPGVGNLTVSTSSAAAQFGNLLQTMGMSLVSYTQGGAGLTTYELNCTILDSVGHQQQQDVINTLNGLMQEVVGNNLAGSSVSVAVPGTPAAAGSSSSILTSLSNLFSGASPSAPSTSLSQWFENNAGYIGLGVVAVVALNAFLGKRR